ncbi:MAG: hypothetical protein IMY71_05910, partial [Bacteroidetes bacterium]|nr:hypothetical protein [Bacteroidota bacterium]
MLKTLLLVLIPSIVFSQVQEPVVNAVRITTPPIIDGKLNDSCWQDCNPVTDFYMVEPNPGAPVTQPTIVYVCYNDENIYFGIHMSEDKPDAIQATVTQR